MGKNLSSPSVFFLNFIMIGNYLFIGLFIGVLFSNFSKLRKKAQYKSLTNDQIQWIQLHSYMISLEPERLEIPKSVIRCFIYHLTHSSNFHNLSKIILLFDLIHQAVLVRSAINYSISSTFANVMFYCCLFFYSLEFFLKLIALGSRRFFSSISQRLETVVLVFWIVYFGLDEGLDLRYQHNSAKDLSRALKLLKTFSILRFLALFKPIRNFFINIFASLSLLLNMTILLFVLFFIYGILGCKFFHNIKEGAIIDDYNNFSNIFYAMMTLFRFATADEWRLIIKDTSGTAQSLGGLKWGQGN